MKKTDTTGKELQPGSGSDSEISGAWCLGERWKTETERSWKSVNPRREMEETRT